MSVLLVLMTSLHTFGVLWTEKVVKAHPQKGPKILNDGPLVVGLHTYLHTAGQERSR